MAAVGCQVPSENPRKTLELAEERVIFLTPKIAVGFDRIRGLPDPLLIEIKGARHSVSGMKAVIVDETQHVSSRLAPSLQAHGYGVTTASGIGEARWVLGDLDADVVLVCAARSGTQDVDVVQAIRGDGERAPILVLAKGSDTSDRVAVLDAGADDVVTSPVGFDELAARLRALQRRGPLVSEPLLRVGDLVLDPGAHTAWRQQNPDAQKNTVQQVGPDISEAIELTLREVTLLRMLMRNPGQVLTRTSILEAVWGMGVEAESNVVDQLVSHLRAKVDRPFGRNDIQTVRGVGYRLVDSNAVLHRMQAS